MHSTVLYRARTCLDVDDVEGLHSLYPVCDRTTLLGVQPTVTCVKRTDGAGVVRVLIVVGIPYAIITVCVVLLQNIVRRYSTRAVHRLEHEAQHTRVSMMWLRAARNIGTCKPSTKPAIRSASRSASKLVSKLASKSTDKLSATTPSESNSPSSTEAENIKSRKSRQTRLPSQLTSKAAVDNSMRSRVAKSTLVQGATLATRISKRFAAPITPFNTTSEVASRLRRSCDETPQQRRVLAAENKSKPGKRRGTKLDKLPGPNRV